MARIRRNDQAGRSFERAGAIAKHRLRVRAGNGKGVIPDFPGGNRKQDSYEPTVIDHPLVFNLDEELAKGAALRMAIRNAFNRVATTIVDCNMTHVIVAIVLVRFDQGPRPLDLLRIGARRSSPFDS